MNLSFTRFSCLMLLGMMLGCSKKDLNIDITQQGCSNFQLKGSSYDNLVEPSCTGNPLTGHVDISSVYSGASDCFDKIVFESATVIEDSLGNAISGILWASEILQSDSTIFVNTASKLITFRFYFTFPSSAAAQSFSDVFVQYHGVNSQSEITKSMNIRFYGSCSTPVLSHFDQTTIHVRDTSVRVRISIGDDDVDDYLSQPISVWLNGEWKFTNHALSRAEVYNWTLRADTTNALLVICNGHAHSFDNYAMVTFNSFHAVKCDLDPGKGHVIYIKP